MLGRDIARIRKTNQTPPKVSVIDVVQTITGKDAKHAAGDVRNLCSSYPEVDGIFVHSRFPGRGQGKCWCRVKTVVSPLWRNFRMNLLDALMRLTSIVLSLPCGCLDHIGFGSFLQSSTRFFSDENEKALQDALGRLGPLWDALGTLWSALGRAPPSRAHPKWGQIGPTSNSQAEGRRTQP